MIQERSERVTTRTFLAVPRLDAAVVFFVAEVVALGFPASVFLGAAAVDFLVVVALVALFAGAAFATGFLVVLVGAALVVDLEAPLDVGLEF
jgi:hypothetical protein